MPARCATSRPGPFSPLAPFAPLVCRPTEASRPALASTLSSPGGRLHFLPTFLARFSRRSPPSPPRASFAASCPGRSVLCFFFFLCFSRLRVGRVARAARSALSPCRFRPRRVLFCLGGACVRRRVARRPTDSHPSVPRLTFPRARGAGSCHVLSRTVRRAPHASRAKPPCRAGPVPISNKATVPGEPRSHLEQSHRAGRAPLASTIGRAGQTRHPPHGSCTGRATALPFPPPRPPRSPRAGRSQPADPHGLCRAAHPTRDRVTARATRALEANGRTTHNIMTTRTKAELRREKAVTAFGSIPVARVPTRRAAPSGTRRRRVRRVLAEGTSVAARGAGVARANDVGTLQAARLVVESAPCVCSRPPAFPRCGTCRGRALQAPAARADAGRGRRARTGAARAIAQAFSSAWPVDVVGFRVSRRGHGAQPTADSALAFAVGQLRSASASSPPPTPQILSSLLPRRAGRLGCETSFPSSHHSPFGADRTTWHSP